MTGATFRVEHPEVFILGASFGGAAALLASRDPRVVKVAALSPVVDWTKQEGTNEPLDERTEKLILAAWGNGYRLSADPFGKLAAGDFYNPVRKAGEMQGKKILIIHTKDDPTVPFAPAEAFAKEVGAKFVALRTGGHFGVSSALEWRLWWRINMFFKAK